MKVLFVVGPHASGKTYSIKESLSCDDKNSLTTVIDTGPIMRNVHKTSGSSKKIGEWVEELETNYGKDITSKIVANEVKKRIEEEQNENIIIIGYRTFDSINYLINDLGIEDFRIIYVDAPMSLLYKNYCNREGNKKTFNEFEHYINEEERTGLVLLKAYAMLNYDNFYYFYKKDNNEMFSDVISDYFKKSKVRVLSGEKHES